MHDLAEQIKDPKKMKLAKQMLGKRDTTMIIRTSSKARVSSSRNTRIDSGSTAMLDTGGIS